MTFYNRVVIAAFLFTAFGVGSASAVECPMPQLISSEGAILQTAADIAIGSQLLEKGASKAISAMIVQLRQKNPKKSDGAILNYLLTAYCPVVNRMSGVSENQKRAKLKLFKHQAMTNLPF